MKKKHLIAALEEFDDEDHIMIGDDECSFVPEITKICGGSQTYMGYYCCSKKGHSGRCYSRNKNVYFDAEIED